jgi:hypothetical protein
MDDRISLAYWFPILETTGVRVPKTDWWETDANLWSVADGQPDKSADEFLDDLKRRSNEHGYPLFLRTGHTSGKHSWKNTCHVTGEDRLGRCVYGLIESSLMAMPSMPLNVWVVRELLDLDVHFNAFWGDMPIATERRYFIEAGSVICSHPYWPAEAFETTHQKPSDWAARLAEMNAISAPELSDLSAEVSEAFEGAWSLDWARHKNGEWYAIDMAPAEVSYHWPRCDAFDT